MGRREEPGEHAIQHEAVDVHGWIEVLIIVAVAAVVWIIVVRRRL